MESIVKLERAQQMLAEAKSLDDILHVNDLADAAVAYARAAQPDRFTPGRVCPGNGDLG